jgi:hypothetical protein
MPTSRKFTVDDLEIACGELATIPYFPSAERAFVMNLLRKMCPHHDALRFVVDTAVARCKQWPGMSELRGLLCTRYDAADGMDEPNCSIPGFTAEESKAKYLATHNSIKTQSQLPVPEMGAIRQIAAGKSIEAQRAEVERLEKLKRDLAAKIGRPTRPRSEFAYSPEQIAQLEADMANEQLPYSARQLAAQMLQRCRQGIAAEAKA